MIEDFDINSPVAFEVSVKQHQIKYVASEKEDDELENRFAYHPPRSSGMEERYAKIREIGLFVAKALNRLAPDSREMSLALTKLEECIFWANAAIARNEKGEN